MNFVSSFILGISLSIDSFTASLGAGGARRGAGNVILAALPFAICEIVAVSLGWSVGRAAAPAVAAVDHWFAFLLLAGVGGHMIAQGWRSREADTARGIPAGRWRPLLTAMATSIDSAVVGMTIGIASIALLPVLTALGAGTLLMALAGSALGAYTAPRIGRWAEMLGGTVLILLGFKILITHLAAG